MTSYHPVDIERQYCGRCHDFVPQERPTKGNYLIHMIFMRRRIMDLSRILEKVDDSFVKGIADTLKEIAYPHEVS
jgi:hypothetical protein